MSVNKFLIPIDSEIPKVEHLRENDDHMIKLIILAGASTVRLRIWCLVKRNRRRYDGALATEILVPRNRL